MKRKWNGSKWCRPERRLAIYARDGFACLYCGADDQLTLDHVTPVELGGDNADDNLVTCCLSCNSAKQDSSMRAWFAALRDKGVDTTKLSKRIRRHTRRKVDRKLGKRLLAARSTDIHDALPANQNEETTQC